MSVLDVGSWQSEAHRSYRELVPKGYTGIDIQAGRNVDVVVDPYSWPFDSESFDIVISGAAFEHMERFWDVFVEMVRVLKRGGVMCVIAPEKARLHRYPVDCWRFLPDGMKVLADVGKVKLLNSVLENHFCIGTFSK